MNIPQQVLHALDMTWVNDARVTLIDAVSSASIDMHISPRPRREHTKPIKHWGCASDPNPPAARG